MYVFKFKYQPVVDLDGDVIFFEALIRIYRNDQLVPFLSFYEEVIDWECFDLFVINSVVSEMKKLDRPHIVSINITPNTIISPRFLSYIKSIPEDLIGNIIIEITEYHAYPDFDTIRDSMVEMKNIGLRFALDDFGCIYSCDEALYKLPFDLVKLSGFYIENIETDKNKQELLMIIMNKMNKIYKLNIVFEKIENESELLTIKKIMGEINFSNCLFQGFSIEAPYSLTKSKFKLNLSYR